MPGATASFRTISMVRYTPDDPAVDKWRKPIEAKFPGDRLSVYNLFGIGSAQVLVEALKRAGPDLTREKLIAALDGIHDFPIDVYGARLRARRLTTAATSRRHGWQRTRRVRTRPQRHPHRVRLPCCCSPTSC